MGIFRFKPSNSLGRILKETLMEEWKRNVIKTYRAQLGLSGLGVAECCFSASKLPPLRAESGDY